MTDTFFEGGDAGASRKRKKSVARKPAAATSSGFKRSVAKPGALAERRRKASTRQPRNNKARAVVEDVDDGDSDVVDSDGSDDLDLEADTGDGGYDDEAVEAEERETAAEKRLRLAKGYIARLKQNLGDTSEYDAAEIDRDLIAERLQDDALETAGRLHRNVADCYEFPLDPSRVRSIRSNRGHQLSITCVAIDESASVLYTGAKDASIIKWDMKTGKRLHSFPGGRKGVKNFVGHTDHVLSLAVSPDGQYLVSGGRDRVINVWSVPENRHVNMFRHHKDAVTGLVFRRASAQLYSCSLDRSVKLWDLDQMSYVETLFGHQDGVLCIDALSRERAVTVGARDRTVRLWKIVEESQLVFRGSGVGKRRCLQEADGSKSIKGREPVVSDIPGGFLEGSIDVVALIDEENFVSGGDSGMIALWNISKKKPVYSVDCAHGVEDDSRTPRWITSLATLRHTDMFATGSWDGVVRIWQLTLEFRAFQFLAAVSVPGFVNSLRFWCPPGSSGASEGATIIAAVGQEPRLSRLKRIKNVKNNITVISLMPKKAEGEKEVGTTS